jgi:hypothetical protein
LESVMEPYEDTALKLFSLSIFYLLADLILFALLHTS